MKLDVVKICAGLIIVLALLMCSSVATETTWRQSGFELWGYDINFTEHNITNLNRLNENIVYVNTFSELQSALLTADNIVITDMINVTSTLYSNRTQSIEGIGFNSGLTGSVNPLLSTDTDESHKLTLKNLVIRTDSSNDGVFINKSVSAHPNSSFLIDTVWFKSYGNAGNLLHIESARESTISNCWFNSSVEWSGNTVAIFINGTSNYNLNIVIESNQIWDVETGVKAIGNYTEGLRIQNTMMIGLINGVDASHVLYLFVSDSMIDGTYYPIRFDSVDEFHIINNYLGATINGSTVIQINSTIKVIDQSRISGNRILSYATVKGDGIQLFAGPCNIEYISILNNQFQYLDRCINITKGTASVSGVYILGNTMRASAVGIYTDGYNARCVNNMMEVDVTTRFTDNGGTNTFVNNLNAAPYNHGVRASTPTPNGAGDEYYNSTDNIKYCYNGSAWEDLSDVGYYGEAYIYNNAVDTVIETANTPIALRQISSGLVNGWTFDAGSTGAITAYADGTGGTVLVSDAGHGLSNGDIITIRGTTNYNGVFTVSDVTTDNFKITDTWVNDNGASDWVQGASLTAGANSAGKYTVRWQMSSAPDAAMTCNWVVYINAVAQTKTMGERKFTQNDYGCCTSMGILDISAGDVIWLAIQSDGTQNVLNKHGNFNVRTV